MSQQEEENCEKCGLVFGNNAVLKMHENLVHRKPNLSVDLANECLEIRPIEDIRQVAQNHAEIRPGSEFVNSPEIPESANSLKRKSFDSPKSMNSPKKKSFNSPIKESPIRQLAQNYDELLQLLMDHSGNFDFIQNRTNLVIISFHF